MPASLRLEIFTSDYARCIHFYTKVLQFDIVRNEPRYLYIRKGSVYLAALPDPSRETVTEKASYRQPPRGVEIVLEVDDLDAQRVQVVEKGWKLDSDIRMQPWGLRDFRITDPDGYYLRVTTHSQNVTVRDCRSDIHGLSGAERGCVVARAGVRRIG